MLKKVRRITAQIILLYHLFFFLFFQLTPEQSIEEYCTVHLNNLLPNQKYKVSVHAHIEGLYIQPLFGFLQYFDQTKDIELHSVTFYIEVEDV